MSGSADVSGRAGSCREYCIQREASSPGPLGKTLALDTQSSARVSLRQSSVDRNKGIPAGFVRDLAYLRLVKHPNLAEVFEFEVVGDAPHEVRMVYTGHLRCLRVHLRDKGAFAGLALKRALHGCISGLHALHCRGIVHRCLHARSVSFDAATGGIVISDFYDAAFYSEDGSCNREVSIEELLGMEDSSSMARKADIWSLGTVFAEMVTGGHRFFWYTLHLFKKLIDICSTFGTPTEETMPGCSSLKFFSPKLPKFAGVGLKSRLMKIGGVAAVNDLGKQGMDLMLSMFLYDPASRPGTRGLLSHGFLYESKTWPEVLSIACSAASPKAQHRLVATLQVQEDTRAAWSRSFPGHVHSLLQEFLGPVECLPMLSSRGLQVGQTAAVLSDVAVFADLHAASEKQRLLAESPYSNLKSGDTLVQAAAWLIEVSSWMHLPDEIVYRALMIFARTMLGDSNAWEAQLLASMTLALKATHIETPLEPAAYIQHYISYMKSLNMFIRPIRISTVVDSEVFALSKLDGYLGFPTAVCFMDLLTEEMRIWVDVATARQAAEVVLQMSLADDELFVGCPHLSLAVAAWAFGLAVSEESAPTEAWKILRAATEACDRPRCGCTRRALLRIVRGIHRYWQRGAPRTMWFYTAVFRHTHGPGAIRALDGMQFGWPWLRARLAQGLMKWLE